jgi:hypothetical protein
MRHLIKAVKNLDKSLAMRIIKAISLPNHKLTKYPEEEFGMKPWPKGLYAMKVNDAKIDRLIEENLEDPEAFVEKYNLPENWDEVQILDILELLGGEFAPITVFKQNTSRNLARSLMQMIEAYSEPEVYIDTPDFPQKLFQFERMADWLIKLHLVNPNSTRPIKNVAREGMFHEGSVHSLLKDYAFR